MRLMRLMVELPAHLPQHALQGTQQGICCLGMPGSCALAWPAFSQACLRPSPTRGYSTLQARSAFFQPLGCRNYTQVGASFPSLNNLTPSLEHFSRLLPRFLLCWTEAGGSTSLILPTCPLICPPPHSAQMDVQFLLAVNRSRGWCGRLSLHPGLGLPHPTAASYCSPIPRVRGQEGLCMPLPVGFALTYLLWSSLPCVGTSPMPTPHWEEPVHHPLVWDSTLGLVPVTLSLHYSRLLRISQGQVPEPLGRDRKISHEANALNVMFENSLGHDVVGAA